MLLLNTNRKSYMGKPNGTTRFDAKWPWKVKSQAKVTRISKAFIS